MEKVIILLTIFLILITPMSVLADSSGESGMVFHIIHETKSQYKLIDSTLMECQNTDCTLMKPLATGIMPGGFCIDDYGAPDVDHGCFYASFSLNHSAYYKIILNYSDKVRESNVFQSPSLNGRFILIVRSSDLIIENFESNPFSLYESLAGPFIFSLLITIITELIVGYVFVYKIKNYKRILISLVIANFISLPIVWFLMYNEQMTTTEGILVYFTLLLSEVFAMIFEASFIYLINKKSISFKRTLIMSIVMNIASFLLGVILLSIPYYYL
jgi:hypothetical protein